LSIDLLVISLVCRDSSHEVKLFESESATFKLFIPTPFSKLRHSMDSTIHRHVGYTLTCWAKLIFFNQFNRFQGLKTAS